MAQKWATLVANFRILPRKLPGAWRGRSFGRPSIPKINKTKIKPTLKKETKTRDQHKRRYEKGHAKMTFGRDQQKVQPHQIIHR